MSYKNQEIWQIANEIVQEIHAMTLADLLKFEMFETGSQIRRSSKSVKSNIVEGYGRRFYKFEYIHFLIYAQASNDETIDHLETLFLTKSLTDSNKYEKLHYKLNLLGKKLNLFIQTIKNSISNTPIRNQKPETNNQ